MSTSTDNADRIADNSHSDRNLTTIMQTLRSSHTPDEIRQFVDRRIGGLLRVVDAKLFAGDGESMPLQLRFGVDRLSNLSREVVTQSLEVVLGDMAILDNSPMCEPKSGITLRSRGENGERASQRANNENNKDGAVFSSEVAASLAHKLRNYLAAIMSAGEQLQETLDQTATTDQVQLVDLISRAAQEQRILIDRFVHAYGPINVRNQKTNIGQLIRLNLERLENTYGYRIAYDKTAAPVHVNTDYEILGRVITELASNAAEVSPQGSPSLNWSSSGGQLTITISNLDQRASEAHDLLQSKPFVSSKPGHIGLGLSIVRRFVGALRGTLQVTHSDDRTSVIVMIPIQNENQTYLHTERNP